MAVTNYEFYKDEIKHACYEFGMNKYTNKIEGCSYELCKDCVFSKFKDGLDCCATARVKWLYQEHKEEPKLTQEEFNFLQLLFYNSYIVRNKDGSMYVFDDKPTKGQFEWRDVSGYIEIVPDNFKFITWEDKEPWSVTKLLGVKVE